jgi:hypothetical protein
MARYKTFTNGGSLLPGDLNSIEDDYEQAFSAYKHILGGVGLIAGSTAASTLTLPNSTTGVTDNGVAVVYLNPADYAAAPRTTYFNISASCAVNATAPAATFTIGLYPVTAVAGATGVIGATLGTVVAGSTIAFPTPALSTLSNGTSGDFAAPAAGYYALGVVVSATTAAASFVSLQTRLRVRQV